MSGPHFACRGSSRCKHAFPQTSSSFGRNTRPVSSETSIWLRYPRSCASRGGHALGVELQHAAGATRICGKFAGPKGFGQLPALAFGWVLGGQYVSRSPTGIP